MNPFDNACRVMVESFRILEPFIVAKADDGRYVTTDKGPLSKRLQETIGDLLMNMNGNVYCIELKSEQANPWRNFFIEEWSNRSRFNRGWLHKLDTDFLWYHFIDSDELYIIPFRKFREWLFMAKSKRVPGGVGRLYDFPAKEQRKRKQANDTWARCIPIETVREEVGFKLIHPKQFIAEGG